MKYRQKLINHQVEETLKAILFKYAEDNHFVITEMECDQDHLHLLIECSPRHYLPDLIKGLKGVSARLLFKEFPALKQTLWGGHLWNPSYFIATVSEQTESQIKQYIQNQKTKGGD